MGLVKAAVSERPTLPRARSSFATRLGVGLSLNLQRARGRVGRSDMQGSATGPLFSGRGQSLAHARAVEAPAEIRRC